MKVEIKEIRVSDYIHRVKALTTAHWEETEKHFAPNLPEPEVAMYDALEKAGCIVAFGAFCDNEMIGYSIAFVSKHLHYSVPYAHHDMLFLRKDFRNGMTGLRLIEMTESAVRDKGARFFVWHAKKDSAFSKILERRGYFLEDIVYRKDL